MPQLTTKEGVFIVEKYFETKTFCNSLRTVRMNI